MNTENFLELPTKNGMVTVAKSSIAAIEQGRNDLGVKVTLKEKRADGTNLVFDVDLPYTHLKVELNKFEKLVP